MKYLRALLIAFSLYSKVPVPHVEWKEEDMRYQFIFFPFIGALTGGALILWHWICEIISAGSICYVLIGCAIPILITGGFHIDGFMDTADAFHSYRDREEKLRIMKDPHIGAFAVIMLLAAGLVYGAAFSLISDIYAFAGAFVLSRILSALCAMWTAGARADGMLNMISQPAQQGGRKKVTVILVIEGVLICAYMVYMAPVSGSAMIVAAVLTALLYRHRMVRALGGVTGDTAGYFVTVCEIAMAVVCGACSFIRF